MGASTEELSTEIAGTRQALASDIDALQERVSPSAVMQRRKAAVRGRFSSMKDRVMGSGQQATSATSGAASSAAGTVEQRVQGSPLAAGLVAFGVGAVIGGLIPASEAEATLAQRVKDTAQEHGQPVMDQARSAARDMGEQLKQSGAEAVSEVKQDAQDSASRVKDEASSSDGSQGTTTTS